MSHRARKRFGQNFLHDPGVIRRIIQAVSPQPGQRLVEIGPGQGAITLPLLRACGRLDVVELDRDLIEPLARKAADLGELVIHQADALQFDFSALAGKEKLRVVGNLPYNISTPLLFHLLTQSGYIEDMHFMLQKEVVQLRPPVTDDSVPLQGGTVVRYRPRRVQARAQGRVDLRAPDTLAEGARCR
jgi:16S rRNA (adenine1518-N6/adenine1519-N6)-dimethyltransferase